MSRRHLRFTAGGLAAALVTAPSATSPAQETIRDTGRHPVYQVEMEPHALVAWDNLYGDTGLGGGLRLSIPIVRDGFIKSIDDNVAIGFGLDWLHYSDCYFNGPCSANYVMFPVAMQWNFFFTRRWSAFGEPGLFVYKGFIEGCGSPGCQGEEPTSFGVRPAIAVGGRYHFNDYITLTVRLGYPAISAGVSLL